jgi:signal transduction histidine kinase
VFRELTPMQRGVDGLIALAFVLLASFSGVSTGAPQLIPVSLLLGAALALRRWSPPLALMAAWVAAVLQMGLAFGPLIQDAAIPPIIYACAAYGSPAVRWGAFSSSLVGGGVAGVFVARSGIAFAFSSGLSDLPSAVAEFGIFALLTAVTLLLAWTLGVLVATGRQSRANRREAESASREVATEQERTRIARDMHDVVAHSLAVVIAQSDGARMLRRTDPEAVDEALETIAAISRAALADVRVLLQQLRYEGTTAVQPGLSDLDALVERFRASGLDVRLTRSGDAEAVGTAVQLAAFRIVQESLTNALRHGDTGRPAALSLTRTAHGLDIEVTSALPADRVARASSGHGLIGMQERAATVQGHLRAEAEGDRFVVRAWLPAAATATGAVQLLPQ